MKYVRVAQIMARRAVDGLMLRLRPDSPRERLRVRLYLMSAPAVVGLLLAALQLIGIGVVSRTAVSNFSSHDIAALHDDVAFLSRFDVFEPAKTAFAAGDLRVLEGRLRDAESAFNQSLERTTAEQSCPVRINLLLVRETLGDLATREGKRDDAERFYVAAMQLAQQAPAHCFEGNTDANEDRKAIRGDSIPRIQRKIDALHRPPEPPAPSASSVVPQPAPTSLVPTSGPPLPGLDPSYPSSDSAQGGPGPNMPQLPEAAGGQGPVIGPGTGDGPNGGPGLLDPISPDRLPTAGSGQAPGHRLGPGDASDRLRRLLDNSNAYGDNREMPND